MTFVFDRNYNNREQVREFYGEFRALRACLVNRGEYPYNDAFVGLIPGIAGDDEGTAIYLLQTLAHLEHEYAAIEAIREDHQALTSLDDTTRYASVVIYRPDHFAGGTGRIDRFTSARVVPRDGRPFAVLPKGRRTNGCAIGSGTVLVRP